MLAPVVIISIAGILQVFGMGLSISHNHIIFLLQILLDVIAKTNYYINLVPGSGEPPVYSGKHGSELLFNFSCLLRAVHVHVSNI